MKVHRKKAHRINAVEKENPTSPMLPSRLRVLTPEPYDVILDGTISREHAEQLLRSRQAKLMAGGRAVRLIVYHEMPEHLCRTRISSGGLLAALGMSQVYTIANERGGVHDFKRIYPEDRACFNLATNPGGWMIAVVTTGLMECLSYPGDALHSMLHSVGPAVSAMGQEWLPAGLVNAATAFSILHEAVAFI